MTPFRRLISEKTKMILQANDRWVIFCFEDDVSQSHVIGRDRKGPSMDIELRCAEQLRPVEAREILSAAW